MLVVEVSRGRRYDCLRSDVDFRRPPHGAAHIVLAHEINDLDLWGGWSRRLRRSRGQGRCFGCGECLGLRARALQSADFARLRTPGPEKPVHHLGGYVTEAGAPDWRLGSYGCAVLRKVLLHQGRYRLPIDLKRLLRC